MMCKDTTFFAFIALKEYKFLILNSYFLITSVTFAPMNPQKKRLLGLTPAELKALVGSLGMPAFTAKQVAQWLYVKHVRSIDEMTNLSKHNRELLSAEYEVGAMDPIDCQRSKDGTIKYLFPVLTSNPSPLPSLFVETVFIPECSPADGGNRNTVYFIKRAHNGCRSGIYRAPESRQITVLHRIIRYFRMVIIPSTLAGTITDIMLGTSRDIAEF